MRGALFLIVLFGSTVSAEGQDRAFVDDQNGRQVEEIRKPEPQPSPTTASPAGHIAKSLVGRAGQRQTRDQVVSAARPMARIESRVGNRVQSRIRSRIDKDYDPQANATSPFAAAEEQTRRAGRR